MTNKTYGTMYYVDDMKKAVSFYRHLGFTPTLETDGWSEIAIGESRLCLHIKEPGKTYAANGIMIFEVSEVKSLFEKMKRESMNVFGLHEIAPQAWTFHMKDPSNNELSFYGTP